MDDFVKELQARRLFPGVKLVDGRAHLANNNWTCHEREATMLADVVCQGYITITVVLLHKGVRDIRLRQNYR